MGPPHKRSNLLQFAFIFAIMYLVTEFGMRFFFPQAGAPPPQPGIHLRAEAGSFKRGHHPALILENVPAAAQSHGFAGWVGSTWCTGTRVFTDKTADDCRALRMTASGETYTLPERCPQPPVDALSVQPDGVTVTPLMERRAEVVCETVPPVPPGGSVRVSLAPWSESLFAQSGTYEVRLPGAKPASGTGAPLSGVTRFDVREPGAFTKLFRTFITKPFLNFLILVASFLPGHNLGIAIIILTLVVKLLLYFPTQQAMEGQKKMQMLQPKLEELKKKYPNDSKKQQEETMHLWKEHKINPFSSCLPLLLQFPILIGLFYVVQDGSNLELSRHLIYPFYQNLDWKFGTWFLGLDLLQPSVFIMPPLLIVLQFLQMKLAFAITKRKASKEQKVIDVGDKKPMDPQQLQQKMMLYGLPIMIGVFAFQFPAAVSLYWGVSTLFAIGQQVIVNREHLRV
ncbi:MAG: preprotein translocase subunit YidC [Candidatus Peregrinibacteria bacterium Greene0416_19]|nr:MAG: preprotein translocase subunit YidC [Candidatus Peregrinibacteria bacterium Greene0416_19]